MILINKSNKCRVWINENITLNFPSRRTKTSEVEFLQKIVKLFEEKCLKSTMSIDFFSGIAKNYRLTEAISSI